MKTTQPVLLNNAAPAPRGRDPLVRLLLAGALGLLLASCSCRPVPPAPVPIPPIHDFTLKNLASEFPGEIETVHYAGQVQLIIFLLTDDPGCRATLAEWNRLQQGYAAAGFTVIGVVADDRPLAAITAEAAELAPEFPLGLADVPVVTAFGGLSAIRAVRTLFLLDRAGNLAHTYTGFVPMDTLRDDIAALLAAPAPSEDEP